MSRCCAATMHQQFGCSWRRSTHIGSHRGTPSICDTRCARRIGFYHLKPGRGPLPPRQLLMRRIFVRAVTMKLARLVQGSGAISVSVGNGSGDSDEDIDVRIKADAPALWP